MSLNSLIWPRWLTCDSSSLSLEIINAVCIVNASSQLSASQKKIELSGGMPLALINLSESVSPSLAPVQSESRRSGGFLKSWGDELKLFR